MHWRILKAETNTGAFNMAADEYLLSYSAQPCIRFYQWKPACISLGYNQLLSDINEELSQNKNIDIIRRPTGGRAVFHDTKDYTYSVIAPLLLFGNVQKAYKEICSWLLEAFQEIGIQASLNGTNDIVIGKRKISGNAMVVKKNKLLQHGTIVADANLELMPQLLKFKGGKEKIASVHEQYTKDFFPILLKHFIKNKEYKVSTFTESETNVINQLASERYASPQWTKGTAKEKAKGACHVILG